MAGIEPNPGPSNLCSVCKIKVNWKSKSVLCTKCKAWCHVRKKNNCSGLDNFNEYNNNWCCPKCHIPILEDQPAISKFKILQFNCNGLRNKITEIMLWMIEKDIKIAAFQETKLSENIQIGDLGNFTLLRKDRLKDSGGGLAFLIHNSIQFLSLPDIIQDPHIEYQAIKIMNIRITISAEIEKSFSERKTFTNFNKAKWPEYTKLTEEEFSKLLSSPETEPKDVYSAEKQFRNIINKVSKLCIPSGRIKEVIPEVPTEAVRKMTLRDSLRSADPHSEDIQRLNNEISSLILNCKKDKW